MFHLSARLTQLSSSPFSIFYFLFLSFWLTNSDVESVINRPRLFRTCRTSARLSPDGIGGKLGTQTGPDNFNRRSVSANSFSNRWVGGGDCYITVEERQNIARPRHPDNVIDRQMILTRVYRRRPIWCNPFVFNFPLYNHQCLDFSSQTIWELSDWPISFFFFTNQITTPTDPDQTQKGRHLYIMSQATRKKEKIRKK